MKKCVTVAIFGFLFLSMFTSVEAKETEFLNTCHRFPSKEAYQPFFSYINSLPIIITNNSNFTDYGFLGDGTAVNPFIIENLNITTTKERGIYVYNTTKHFLIQNCFVNASVNGIVIESVKNETAKIENNICIGNSIRGIQIYHSPSSQINNNICEFNGYFGIHVRNSSNCQVNNNTCFDNGRVGIFVDLSESSSISNNTCDLNFRGGIVLEESPLSNVADNKCKNNDNSGGISLSQSNRSVVVNNLCVDNIQDNIMLHESNDSFVLNNLCSGRGVGIVVVNGGNVTIDNNNCSSNVIGIFVNDAERSKITNNFMYKSGFRFYDLNKDDFQSYTVLNNTVNDKKFGFFASLDDLTITKSIYGQLFFADCSNVRIKNQYLSDTITGITMFYCSRSMIRSSFCSNNWYYGINLVGSSNIEILDNNCSSNYAGIVIENSFDSELTYNFLQNNIVWGVVLDLYSYNNSVHHNSFFDNNLYYGSAQAKDDGQNNTWYDEEAREGNFWSDYFVVVGSYYIDGYALTQDLYPLSEPPVYRNKNNYYAFFSFAVIIPLMVYGYFQITIKKKRFNNQEKKLR